MLRLTFNPGLALTGFRTTRPRTLKYHSYLTHCSTCNFCCLSDRFLHCETKRITVVYCRQKQDENQSNHSRHTIASYSSKLQANQILKASAKRGKKCTSYDLQQTLISSRALKHSSQSLGRDSSMSSTDRPLRRSLRAIQLKIEKKKMRNIG